MLENSSDQLVEIVRRSILGRNADGHYVTWHFHLLDDESVSVYWGHYYMEDRDAAVRDFDIRE